MSGEPKTYTLAELAGIVEHLNELKKRHAWIGGQAVGVWASRYLTAKQAEELGLSLPLTSKDGDIRATEEVARLLAQRLNARITPVRLKDHTHGKAWILTITLDGHTIPIIIDVLERVPGLDTEPTIEPQGIIFQIPISPSKQIKANVLDPVSLLYTKADVWLREKDAIDQSTGLPKKRSDEKHLIVLGKIMSRYLQELQRYEQRGIKIPTTVEKETDRLRKFLTKYPTLPLGVAADLNVAFLGTGGGSDGGPGGGTPGARRR